MLVIDKPTIRLPKGKRKWCHMMASSVEELHKYAKLIGLKPEWFQDKPNRPHYDIYSSGKIYKAYKYGAIKLDSKMLIRLGRRWYENGAEVELKYALYNWVSVMDVSIYPTSSIVAIIETIQSNGCMLTTSIDGMIGYGTHDLTRKLLGHLHVCGALNKEKNALNEYKWSVTPFAEQLITGIIKI